MHNIACIINAIQCGQKTFLDNELHAVFVVAVYLCIIKT